MGHAHSAQRTYEVLRTRTELTATDDIFIEQLGEPFSIDREQATYQWWGAGMGFPLLEITEIFGLPLTATFQDLGESSDVVNAPAAMLHAVSNPVQHGQQLQWETPIEWTFIDGAIELWQGSVQCLHGTERCPCRGIHVARCGRDDRPDRRTIR